MNAERLNLLIVEDDVAHVEAIRRAFETAGTNVDIRAVRTLREFRASVADRLPDLALIDLNLPDGQAVEVLTYPPETAPFPILVMTAFGSQEIVAEVMKAGALDYVVKSPEAFATMPHTTERVFREWKLLQKRKRAEEALRDSEARLRDITFSMADWEWEVDEKGVYTYSSSKGIELLGDVIGKTPFDFMPPDEAKRVAAIFSEIAQNKAPIKDLENWSIRKNGERICLLTNGVPILDKAGNLKGYYGVDKDITERKRAEAALRESEQRYREVFDGTPDGIIVHDANGIILDANDVTARNLETTRAALIGRRLAEFVTSANAAAIGAHAASVLSGETQVFETTYISASGKPTPAEVHEHRIQWKGGLAIQSNARDITERKRAEAEIVKQLYELRRWQTVTLGREGRIGDLKREVNALAKRLGEKPRYGSVEAN